MFVQFDLVFCLVKMSTTVDRQTSSSNTKSKQSKVPLNSFIPLKSKTVAKSIVDQSEDVSLSSPVDVPSIDETSPCSMKSDSIPSFYVTMDSDLEESEDLVSTSLASINRFIVYAEQQYELLFPKNKQTKASSYGIDSKIQSSISAPLDGDSFNE